MRVRKKTFGESLSHFVRSIDIVDTSTKDNVLSVIASYLENELDIRFFNFYVEGSINQKVGLIQTDWGRGISDRGSFSITDSKGSYQGQVSFCYDKKVLLWIVAPNQGPLEFSETYLDLCNHVESSEIPIYVKRTDNEIFTSIIRPVKDESRIYGVVDFESVQYLEYSKKIEEELSKISESISTLYILNKAHESQRKNTKREIDYLTDLKNSSDDLLHLTKPRIFIAFSSRAEPDVIASIRKVLDAFEKKVQAVYWNDISDSGTITQQILREVKECRYGICYFSEPSEREGKERYQDNPNVLIEAGMLSALSHEDDFDNWIPIREYDSCTMPFDLASSRILSIERLSGDKLNVERFEIELQRTLSQWSEFDSQ